MEYAKFPMEYVNVTQVPNNAFSHKGSMSAWDGAGRDTGTDDGLAPYTGEISWKDNPRSNTGVLFTNTVPVKCADGITRQAGQVHTLFWHDNDISDLWVGKKFKQGEVFYQEGTAGRATGNHIHFNVGVGNYKKGDYPLRENEFDVWEIKGEIDPTKIFFIDDSHKVIKTNGMKWVKYSEPKVEVKPVEVKPVESKPKKKYLYLDKSVVSWKVYRLTDAPIIKNAIGSLAPSKFGGLKYEILEERGGHVYVIKTTTWGKVQIFAGPTTKSKIVEE